MVKILICDDDRNALDLVTAHVEEYYDHNCVIRSFIDPTQAAACALEAPMDIALLDILMPGMSGVELAELMRKAGCVCEIAFLTNSNDFASESYRVGALDYLIKPVPHEEMRRLLSAFDQRRQRQRQAVTLPQRGGARRIYADKLAYVEVINHHLHFHLTGGEVVRVRAQLSDYLVTLLQMDPLMQCHRSFVVNLDHVCAYAPGEVRMVGGERISVTGSYGQFEAICLQKFFGKREGQP